MDLLFIKFISLAQENHQSGVGYTIKINIAIYVSFPKVIWSEFWLFANNTSVISVSCYTPTLHTLKLEIEAFYD